MICIVHKHQWHDHRTSKPAHNLPYPVERGLVLLADGSNVPFLIGLFHSDLQQGDNLSAGLKMTIAISPSMAGKHKACLGVRYPTNDGCARPPAVHGFGQRIK